MTAETIWVHGSNAQRFTASAGIERTDDDSGLVVTAPWIAGANLQCHLYPPVLVADLRYFLPVPSERGECSSHAAVCLEYRIDATAGGVTSGSVAPRDGALALESPSKARVLKLVVPLEPECRGIAVRVELRFALTAPDGPAARESSCRDGYAVNLAGRHRAKLSDPRDESAQRPALGVFGNRVTIMSARAQFAT